MTNIKDDGSCVTDDSEKFIDLSQVDLFDFALKSLSDRADLANEPAPGQRKLLNREPIKEELAKLSELEPLKAFSIIIFQWLVIVGSGYAAVQSQSVLVWFVAAVVIMTRKQALGILMHDGSHGLVCRPRWLNDAISNFFLAFPMGVATEFFRDFHYRHHLGNGDHHLDPELLLKDVHSVWDMPLTGRRIFAILLADLTGQTAMSEWAYFVRLFSPWYHLKKKGRGVIGEYPVLYAQFFIYYALLFSVIIYFSLWWEMLFLWILPSLTILPALARVRTIGEHCGVAAEHELNATRSVEAGFLEKFFFAPCGINFHLDHHLFPSVPFYNLPALHRLLLTQEDFRRYAHRTKSYLGFKQGVLQEVTR